MREEYICSYICASVESRRAERSVRAVNIEDTIIIPQKN